MDGRWTAPREILFPAKGPAAIIFFHAALPSALGEQAASWKRGQGRGLRLEFGGWVRGHLKRRTTGATIAGPAGGSIDGGRARALALLQPRCSHPLTRSTNIYYASPEGGLRVQPLRWSLGALTDADRSTHHHTPSSLTPPQQILPPHVLIASLWPDTDQ